jgi:hypothetical protein
MVVLGQANLLILGIVDAGRLPRPLDTKGVPVAVLSEPLDEVKIVGKPTDSVPQVTNICREHPYLSHLSGRLGLRN